MPLLIGYGGKEIENIKILIFCHLTSIRTQEVTDKELILNKYSKVWEGEGKNGQGKRCLSLLVLRCS